MKMFFIKIAQIVIPVCIILIGINYYSDPSNLFKNGKYENTIAKYLCDSLNVTQIKNYDERQPMKSFILNLRSKPERIIIGSSRIMELNNVTTNIGNYINCSVSGASIEDYLALYDLVEKKGLKPDHIVFGLDPWLLNGNNNLIRWKSISSDYFDMLEKIGLQDYAGSNSRIIAKVQNMSNKYSEALSFSYFQRSLFSIRSKNDDYLPTANSENENITKRFDGSLDYGKNYKSRTDKNIEDEALEYINQNPVYGLGDYKEISAKKIMIFEHMLQYLIKKNIKISFFLSPYHPLVWDYFTHNQNKYENVFKSEIVFFKLAEKYKATLIGSFNPKKYNLSNSDFYDGMHCNTKTISSIFRNINF